MSSYKKCTVARLRSICEERTVAHAECKTKKQLIDALMQNDLRRDENLQEMNDDNNYDNVNDDVDDVCDVESDDDASSNDASNAAASERSVQLRGAIVMSYTYV